MIIFAMFFSRCSKLDISILLAIGMQIFLLDEGA